ncbi:MAG: DUF3592 domain-containing protein [Proteobacteria bacterium]|nr:DUF3592 domain-containing protein [Pseudomonadota bacterium]MBU1714343.1 DUF3592 domain-containing protein [Pseudomonadota bacterium]
MFDAIFSSMKAWNMIWMLFGGLIVLGIGALMIWDFVSVRLSRRRVYGQIVGVRMTGEKAPGSKQEEKPEQKPTTGSKPKESFGQLFRRSPFSAIFGSAFALVIICVPLSFLVFGGWQSYDVLTLRANGIVVPAVVVDIERKSDGESDTTYAPVLAFTDRQGKQWQLTDRLSSSRKKFKRGDKTEVYYDQANPQRFIMKDFWRYMIFNLVFMSIPFLLYFLLAYTSRHKQKAAGREKKNYASEMYRPVFEFKNLQGELVQADGDSTSNWISNKIPGRLVKILVDDENLDTVRRPGQISLIIGLIFVAPGLLLISGAIANFEFNVYSMLIGLAVLGYLAYKLSRIIKPRSEWETRSEFKTRMSREREKKHPAGRTLTDGEIRERVLHHDRSALLWSPLMAMIALGLFAGGWYLYLDLQGFSGKALSVQGEVVRLESRSNSGSNAGGPTYYPVIRFLANGEKKVSFTDKIGSNPPLYQIGDQVKVLYDPESPGKAIIDHGLLNCLPAVALIGAGGLMSWWLVVILTGILRRGKRLAHLGVEPR